MILILFHGFLLPQTLLERFKCPLLDYPEQVVRILPSIVVHEIFRVPAIFSDGSLVRNDKHGHENTDEYKDQEKEEGVGPCDSHE